MIRQVDRTFDLLDSLRENYAWKNDILSIKRGNEWVKYSVDEYYRLSHLFAYAMLAKGLPDKSKIITICSNRPEWNIADMGINLAGMVHVPVYPTLNSEDYSHIFRHSDAQIIILGSISLYNKIKPVIEGLESKPAIILMDKTEGYECMDDLYSLGEKSESRYCTVLDKIKKETLPEDLATIIYTSGTTGTPKGVMLSHRNLMFNAYGHALRQSIDSSNKMLSFLPLCHIYERSMNYEYQYLGVSIYYAESISTIQRDLADGHADGFCAVPRVLEMMYYKFEAAGKNLSGLKKFIYSMAWSFANKFNIYNDSFLHKIQLKIYDKLIYSKWRENLGGKEMLIISGGSSINPRIIRTFNAASLHVYEGYGMTESSPVIAVNNPSEKENIIGTVGTPLKGTEISFTEDGEILVRGPHVMLGYYKDKESTDQAIDKDGWLHTGDVGMLVDGKYLKITDRKKEIFKMSNGKYLAPQSIENKIRESSFILNCMVIGENQKFASAIILPDFERLHFWAAKHNISYTTNDELIQNPKVIAKIHSIIEKVNSGLAPFEKIKRERIINDTWDINNNMLSQTLKLKRKNIADKYSELIQEIYK